MKRVVSRRKLLQGIGLGGTALAMGPLLEACSPTSVTPATSPSLTSPSLTSPSPAAETVVKGGILKGSGTEFASLNPLIVTNLGDRTTSNLMFDPLVYFDDSQTPVPMLAEAAPQISADGLSYTFNLRPDVKWSDGRPLTVDDVVWTYSLIYDPKYEGFNYRFRADAVKFIESVTAPDERTIVLKSKTVYAPLLLQFGLLPILPKHVLGELDANALNTAPFNDAPYPTSGPFIFDRWEKGSIFSLKRNDAYYRGAANIDGIVNRFVSPESQVSALITAETDSGNVTVAELPRVEAADNINVRMINTAFHYYIAFNLDPNKRGSTLFGDKTVRQALLYALDRQAIGDALYARMQLTLDSPIPSDSWAYTRPTKQYSYDPQRAEQMLDAAGWSKNAQGVREKDGVELAFEVVVSSVDPSRIPLTEAITRQWTEIGVKSSPKVAVFAEWLAQIQTKREFDALLLIYPWGGADPDQSTMFAIANTAQGGFNCMNYRNAELDQILRDAVTTLDRDERKELYAEFSEIIMEELPVLPLHSFGTILARNDRVRGFEPGPQTNWINVYWYKDLWLADGK